MSLEEPSAVDATAAADSFVNPFFVASSLAFASKGSAKPVPSALNISLRNSNSACDVVLAARLGIDDEPTVGFSAALGKVGALMEPDRDLDTGIVMESALDRPPEVLKDIQFDV